MSLNSSSRVPEMFFATFERFSIMYNEPSLSIEAHTSHAKAGLAKKRFTYSLEQNVERRFS